MPGRVRLWTPFPPLYLSVWPLLDARSSGRPKLKIGPVSDEIPFDSHVPTRPPCRSRGRSPVLSGCYPSLLSFTPSSSSSRILAWGGRETTHVYSRCGSDSRERPEPAARHADSRLHETNGVETSGCSRSLGDEGGGRKSQRGCEAGETRAPCADWDGEDVDLTALNLPGPSASGYFVT